MMTWRDAACLAILGGLLLSTRWFTVNTSPSVPRGLYRYVATDTPLERGELVRIPAVAFGRAWWARWLPLLKPVVAIAGDVVCVTTDELWVRGVSYGPVYQTHRGKSLPVFWGCHALEHGTIFVASQEEKSLDSRYIGPVQADTARRVVPLWTWR
jgi:type IV secretory pathway protease TraF